MDKCFTWHHNLLYCSIIAQCAHPPLYDFSTRRNQCCCSKLQVIPILCQQWMSNWSWNFSLQIRFFSPITHHMLQTAPIIFAYQFSLHCIVMLHPYCSLNAGMWNPKGDKSHAEIRNPRTSNLFSFSLNSQTSLSSNSLEHSNWWLSSQYCDIKLQPMTFANFPMEAYWHFAVTSARIIEHRQTNTPLIPVWVNWCSLEHHLSHFHPLLICLWFCSADWSTMPVAVHTINFRGLAGAIFICISLAVVLYVIGFATVAWDVYHNRHLGLWESCSCGKNTNMPGIH